MGTTYRTVPHNIVGCASLLICLCIQPMTSAQNEMPDPAMLKQLSSEQEVIHRIVPLIAEWLPAAQACQEACGSLLTVEGHRAEADFLAAKIAVLRGEPTTAIDILDHLLAARTEQKAPGFNVPAAAVAALWRGAIARYHGDRVVASDSYGRLLEMGTEKTGAFVHTLANLYLAETAMVISEDRVAATRHLALVIDEPLPTPRDRKVLHAFYCDWARYLTLSFTDGPERARNSLSGSREWSDWLPILALQHLGVIGVLLEVHPLLDEGGSVRWRSLELVAQNRTSRIDRSLAQFMLGCLAAEKKDLDVAAGHYRAVLESDAFLAPEAGMRLLSLLKSQGKEDEFRKVGESMVQRFPGYGEAIKGL